MWQAAAAMGAGALLGGLMGGKGSQQEQYTQKILAPESELEKQTGTMLQGGLTDFQKLIGAGPGQSDVESSLASQRSLADMLQQYSQGGFQPTQQQIGQQADFARQLFSPQQEMLNQNFTDAGIAANRNAARMGRAGNDPILMAKMAQERSRQQSMLNSQIGAQGMNMALQLPMQQLGFAQQLAQVRGGLASQALANRQALMSMGQGIRGQEQNFRAGTASSNTTYSQPGNFLNGAVAGMGTGLGAASMLNSMGAFGSGTPAPAPTAATTGTSGMGSSPRFGAMA